ncbi:hypothetical protein [Alkalisalibacterium limincola]|uniref:hypothetical protein n=1 Tax=Alkalisalibacterium limincola TaxID=2699169 RepID=UPI003CCDD290
MSAPVNGSSADRRFSSTARARMARQTRKPAAATTPRPDSNATTAQLRRCNWSSRIEWSVRRDAISRSRCSTS